MHYRVLHALLMRTLDVFPGSFLYFIPNLLDFSQFSRQFFPTFSANLLLPAQHVSQFVHSTILSNCAIYPLDKLTIRQFARSQIRDEIDEILSELLSERF